VIKNESRNEVYNSILSRRSIRRFQQKPIKLEILKKMVNTGRLAPSAANLQPLEFFIVNEKNLCDQIFETIGWAGYIKPKWTPAVNERPSAYIVVLVNNEKNPWYLRDVSFATQNIVLFAESLNIGSCILCNINKESIRKILNIPNNIIIDSLIALGYKAEKSVVEDYSGSIEYWRDKNEVLHVPKRKIEDIIHINKF
jgi:nitroreductase